jgi:RNA polymerase sigma-70 factor (ECF subfamily)
MDAGIKERGNDGRKLLSWRQSHNSFVRELNSFLFFLSKLVLTPIINLMFLSKAKKKAAWVQSALERLERPLLQYAYSILQDIDRARDTVQETFMRLHTQDQAAIEDHLSQWLFTVCRNCALKSLKKESRYISVENEEFEHHVVETVTPLQAMARRETIERLMEHVKALPKNRQEVVRLRFHGGLSYNEISEITGLTPGNVGFILNAAMHDLRERMESDEQDEKMIYLTRHIA